MQLPLAYLREDLIEEFELLRPFGKGNEKPLFADREISAGNIRILGKNENVLKMKLRDRYGAEIEGICFRNIDKLKKRAEEGTPLCIAYYPAVNSYKGRKTIQAVVTDCL